MDHWSQQFEHEALATPEAKESFTTAMSKYGSESEAIIGGFNAMKQTGKPFKLPESLDKLPDDNIRGEFTSGVQKLLGIEPVTDVKQLEDLDLTVELPEGAQVNEEFANSFKEFVTEKGLPKSVVQEMVGFHNKSMAAAMQKIEAAKAEAAEKTNQALIKHFGDEKKVAEQSELVKRAFKDHAGLTAEEFEQVGEALASSAFTKDPILTRAMMKLVAPIAAEGSSDEGEGGNPPKTYDLKEQTVKENPKTAKAMGWDK